MSKETKQDIVTGAIPDNEIITRVLNGEKDLYALLIRKYNQRLYRIGMSMINDDNEVEDVMQVAYIKAYENLAKFESRSGFPTWLTRILINECLLRIKKRKKQSVMTEEMFPHKIYHSGDSQTPLGKVLNTELKILIEDAIRRLPEKYRTIFVMREIENMNVAETQKCLDLSEVNVKVRLNRAKAMLRESLSTYYKNDDIFHFQLLRCDRVTNSVMEQVKPYR